MVALWLIIVLAIVQGILEWLPVSSEGWLFMILTWAGETENALAIALFMHLGTMIAVIIRFRKDFILLFNLNVWKEFQARKEAAATEDNTTEVNEDKIAEEEEAILTKGKEQRILWKFILIATAATGVIGIPIYLLLKFVLADGDLLTFADGAVSSGDIITMVIGLFLIGTGIFIIISRRKTASKSIFEMKTWEMIVVGAVQGLALIPGVSRSGSTVGALLIEGVEEEDALRGSFLLSVPAVLGGNVLTIVVDAIQGEFSLAGIPWYGMILALVISGVVGYLTIDFFLWVARKINFGWFCIVVGALALIITLIVMILALTTGG